ncbi:MAG: T9SS type A sorting domain-containing protein, partial [Candidatus Cloacimonetes bacterium]|nr:T9SS type A sorting domain-containing protein [Candidatus Cloacimonadota bacterium]
IKLEIYNLKGQKIRHYSISNDQSSIIWDGTDQIGKPVSSGIYLYKLVSGNENIATKKMLLLK